MIKINLLGETLAAPLPKKADKAAEQQAEQVYVQEASSRRVSLPIAGALVCLAFSAIGLVYYMYMNRVMEEREARRVELDGQKKALEKYNSLYSQYQSQKDVLKKKLEVIQKIKAKQELTVHVLEELANCVPDDVWFDEIYVTGKNVTITGSGGTFEAIDNFRGRLSDNKKWFTKVNQQGGTKVSAQAVSFTITFEVVEEIS
jgi:type IV pilus assembly protein PilN